MNTRAGLGEYIMQTHNTIFFENSMGGLNPPNPPSGYASARDNPHAKFQGTYVDVGGLDK